MCEPAAGDAPAGATRIVGLASWAAVPVIEETVDTSGPYVSYGFGPGYKGVVCYMTISKTNVKLGVANGTSLPDPHRLLQGSGKNVRHVPLSKVDELEQTGLDDLIRAAHTAWKKRAG